MAENFDPYYKWLGIPPEEQPADHYRLLGLRIYESDADVIEHAVDRLMSHLRTLQVGQHALQSQQILNEVATARITLLNADRKRDYDASLQQRNEAAGGQHSISLKSGGPEWAGHRQKIIRQLIAAATLAVVAVAIIVAIIIVGANRKPDNTDEDARAARKSPSKPDMPSPKAPTSVAAEDSNAQKPAKKEKPQLPAATSLVFDFRDEAHLKKYWEWNYAWTFAADGGRAARGARSFFKSRHRFSGQLTIDMDFRFGRARFSNTGGCWITIWGQRLSINNGWRSLNAKIHIYRDNNAIIFSYNGKTRRIELSPQTMAEPTAIEIRWRSRTSHFKRIEVKAEKILPLAP